MKAVSGQLTIGLDTMFQAVEFPAGITDLDTGLTDVDRDTFAHNGGSKRRGFEKRNGGRGSRERRWGVCSVKENENHERVKSESENKNDLETNPPCRPVSPSE